MNQIIFEKWHDPFAPLVKNKEARVSRHPREDEDDKDYHDAMATFDLPPKENPYWTGDKVKDNGPAIVGPYGIIPLRESMLPGALFNFWVGHTNFDLTRKTVNTMKAVPGVEAIDVYTRYRFRLAIARAFKEGAVKSAMEASVQIAAVVEPPKPKTSIDAVHTMLAKKFKYWAIVKLPNGMSQCVGGETAGEVVEKTKLFPSDSSVVTSWGEK